MGKQNESTSKVVGAARAIDLSADCERIANQHQLLIFVQIDFEKSFIDADACTQSDNTKKNDRNSAWWQRGSEAMVPV
jgi:hypothetical protein